MIYVSISVFLVSPFFIKNNHRNTSTKLIDFLGLELN